MAGIGFELRKLIERDDLTGLFQGYSHAALATAGPWLLTIVSLAAIVALGIPATTPEELANFRVIVVYNFAFSLVLTGAPAIVTTRYLADGIYAKDVQQAPAAMLGALTLVYGLAIPLATPFFLIYLKLDTLVRLAALLNFMLICGIWTVSVFLTALKNYRAVTMSFAVGMLAGIAGAVVLAPAWSIAGMLAGFDLGLAFTFFTIIARVFAEYPTSASQPFVFLKYFRTHWDMALGALAYNAAIWVDKWLMWLVPEREILKSGLVTFPDYESAMFLAYLSIVPVIAAFTLTIETGFFEKYLQFYDEIQRHAPYSRIHRNHQELIQSFLDGGRNFLGLQGSICVFTILLAPQLFQWLNIGFGQLGIFRLGVLGAFFHGGFLFLSIVLAYFDQRRTVMAQSLLLLGTNGLFTIVSIRLGFPYYGYGYFLASLTAFACAFVSTARLLNHLPYQTFVRHNSSVIG
jgi:polysaccharide biosynthesis protein PelG